MCARPPATAPRRDPYPSVPGDYYGAPLRGTLSNTTPGARESRMASTPCAQ
eukprot:CAMPEP_0119430028 /NCGR_PEP_ID=MMETSP1335-20130426/43326_1 /TAXON_ID=259385 /ORGANISM="Chrysoculter rhomboideus, Strain RCC1486" /LENGTH=50 /DNA_ID=CAMNT_0007455773 /DNA_START=12 /DNA_END=161 /DNA_ORIENTATION=+